MNDKERVSEDWLTPEKVTEERLTEAKRNLYNRPESQRDACVVFDYLAQLKADLAAAEERERAAFEAGREGGDYDDTGFEHDYADWNDYKKRKG